MAHTHRRRRAGWSQAALQAAQEEAALAMAQCTAAKRQVDSLAQQLRAADSARAAARKAVAMQLSALVQHQDSGSRAKGSEQGREHKGVEGSRDQGVRRSTDAASPDLGQEDASTSTATTAALPPIDLEDEGSARAVLLLVRHQQQQIKALHEALGASHAKRAEEARQATHTAEELATTQRQVSVRSIVVATHTAPRHVRMHCTSTSLRPSLRRCLA